MTGTSTRGFRFRRSDSLANDGYDPRRRGVFRGSTRFQGRQRGANKSKEELDRELDAYMKDTRSALDKSLDEYMSEGAK